MSETLDIPMTPETISTVMLALKMLGRSAPKDSQDIPDEIREKAKKLIACADEAMDAITTEMVHITADSAKTPEQLKHGMELLQKMMASVGIKMEVEVHEIKFKRKSEDEADPQV